MGLREERIRASRQWKAARGRFENTEPVAAPVQGSDRWSVMREYFFGSKGVERRPTRALPIERPQDPWARPVASGLRVTWLGHSTTLLEIEGKRVLTDPVFGERASPVSFAGPKRFHPAPVTIDELPPLDAIVISHDHFDHLDYPSVRALGKLGVPIVTSLGVGAHLEAWGVQPQTIRELDWWEDTRIGDLTFHATPARHFSGRGLGTGNKSLWSSWVIRGSKKQVFFSGDTGLTSEFNDVRGILGPFDLVMLEVGAYHPAWGSIHLGPDNALAAHAMLGGGTLLPVHWGTFDLGLHAWDAPAERLALGAAKAGVHLVTPRLGRPIEPSEIEHVDTWWRALGKSHRLESVLEASRA